MIHKTWEAREKEQENFLDKTSWGLSREKRFSNEIKIQDISYLGAEDCYTFLKDDYLVTFAKEQFLYLPYKKEENER